MILNPSETQYHENKKNKDSTEQWETASWSFVNLLLRSPVFIRNSLRLLRIEIVSSKTQNFYSTNKIFCFHFYKHKAFLKAFLQSRSSLSRFSYHYKSLIAFFIYLIYSVLKHSAFIFPNFHYLARRKRRKKIFVTFCMFKFCFHFSVLVLFDNFFYWLSLNFNSNWIKNKTKEQDLKLWGKI